MLYGVNCSVWFKSCRQHVRLTWWIPTSLDIKSIIISFTSNLSVDDSSCLNSLSLKPVGYITCSSSFVWYKFHLAIQWQTRKRPLSTRMATHPSIIISFRLFIFHLFTFLTFALQSLSGHCRLPRYRQPLEKLLNPSSVVFPNWSLYTEGNRFAVALRKVLTLLNTFSFVWLYVLPCGSLMRWRAEKFTADGFLCFFFCFWKTDLRVMLFWNKLTSLTVHGWARSQPLFQVQSSILPSRWAGRNTGSPFAINSNF